MRLFIAVNLPDEIKRAASRIQEKLKLTGADVRWVPVNNFHVTLKFLGEVPQEQAARVIDALAGSLKGSTPFTLSLQGLGGFPSVESPRVVWLGVKEGAPQLEDIALRIEGALEREGFQKEDRPFTGHVTIGRVRSSRNRAQLAQALQGASAAAAGSFPVASIEVMQSVLSSAGPYYECLRSLSI